MGDLVRRFVIASLLAAGPSLAPGAARAQSAGPAAPEKPALAAPAQSDFMDTRLSFTCTHEDMLRDPTVLPSAPGFHCGRPNALGVLFFDNYDTRFSGFETLSHLALYRHYDRGHWDVEGGLIVRINELSEETIKLADGGSYIRVAYWLDPDRVGKTRLGLVAFPVSSDRMRLGYSYRISWGGSPEFFKPNPDVPFSVGKNRNAVPGLKLQLDGELGYAYVGMKSTLLLDPVIKEERAVLAFLGGAGMDVTPIMRIEANGGFFDRGGNELEDVLGEPVYLFGGSAQIALHDGMPVGSSIDYALYRNDPESIARLFRRETYPGGVAWLVSLEGTVIGQTLKDPRATGSTTIQRGYAGDLNVRVKIDYTRLRLDVMVRDLAYILHSIPSLPPYTSFPCPEPGSPECYEATPEIFAAVGADHHFPSLGLTLGGVFGVDLPATLRTPRAADIEGNTTTSTTLVVRNESSRSFLPPGTEVAPIFALKGSARVDFGERFAAFADVYYQYDPNTVTYDRDDAESSLEAKFANFHQLGFNVTLQARF